MDDASCSSLPPTLFDVVRVLLGLAPRHEACRPCFHLFVAYSRCFCQGKNKKGQARVRTSLHFHRPRTLRKRQDPKFPASFRLRSESSAKNKFNLVKYPLQTESAMNKIENNNTIVFIVDPRANKHQIKKAVEDRYSFKIQKINTLIRPDGLKKAFVRLTSDFQALEQANKMGIV